MSNEKVWAVVPAAGVGQRMGGQLPKQYLMLANKPLLAHTLDVICQIPNIAKVVIPLHPQDHYWQHAIHLPYQNYVTVVGDRLRLESVLNALIYLRDFAAPNDWILVHDAVRPCVTVTGILQLLAAIKTDPVGGLWGVPVRDTLKEVDATGAVMKTVARETLWHAQTPQIFRFDLLYTALTKAKQDQVMLTDDASALEYLGYHPKMVQGRYDNIKITWPEDLVSAEYWLSTQSQENK